MVGYISLVSSSRGWNIQHTAKKKSMRANNEGMRLTSMSDVDVYCIIPILLLPQHDSSFMSGLSSCASLSQSWWFTCCRYFIVELFSWKAQLLMSDVFLDWGTQDVISASAFCPAMQGREDERGVGINDMFLRLMWDKQLPHAVINDMDGDGAPGL